MTSQKLASAKPDHSEQFGYLNPTPEQQRDLQKEITQVVTGVGSAIAEDFRAAGKEAMSDPIKAGIAGGTLGASVVADAAMRLIERMVRPIQDAKINPALPADDLSRFQQIGDQLYRIEQSNKK